MQPERRNLITISLSETQPHPVFGNRSLVTREKMLVDHKSQTVDGYEIDPHEHTVGTFDTEEGTILVNFSNYFQSGEVVLEGEALKSFGNSAMRKQSETLDGVRRIQTGTKYHGAEIIGKNANGVLRSVTINLF